MVKELGETHFNGSAQRSELFSPKSRACETTEFANLFQLLGKNETWQEVALAGRNGRPHDPHV
jgi:hypothetical protein